MVDVVGGTGLHLGRRRAPLQTGQVQAYGVGISLGVVVILLTYLLQR